jgi:hypothetical protein
LRATAREQDEAMEEILPGLLHWTAMRETIRQPVHSTYVVHARTLIDPMIPPEGLGVFRGELPAPERILLCNRHHHRHSARFVEAFGCTVHCHRAGLWDLAGTPYNVRGFEFGDEVAPGIVAERVGALTPEETALHVALGPGAVSFADAVMRDRDGTLGFFPDGLLGEDPDAVKRGIAQSLRRLCDERGPDVLLFAHGAPLVGGGERALREFADAVLGDDAEVV